MAVTETLWPVQAWAQRRAPAHPRGRRACTGLEESKEHSTGSTASSEGSAAAHQFLRDITVRSCRKKMAHDKPMISTKYLLLDPTQASSQVPSISGS